MSSGVAAGSTGSSGAGASAGSSRAGGIGGIRIGIAFLIIAAVVMIVINDKTPDRRPFDLDSTAADGFAAVRILLERRGVEPRQVRPDDRSIRSLGAGAVLVVPAPELASDAELAEFLLAAERGARVVYGSDPTRSEDAQFPEIGAPSSLSGPSRRELADSPIDPARAGICDIDELADLGVIDIAFGNGALSPDSLSFVDPDREVIRQRSCYGTPEAAWFRATDVGEPSSDSQGGTGEVIVMGSPYLWVNARLQPAKELGGGVPDNAATAIRLLHRDVLLREVGSTTATVTVVRAVRSSGIGPDGTQNPVELLPFGVKLALVQLLGAFAIFVWWRSRRLGAPMIEPLPVEIAGSELVAAVGSLRHRRGDVDRAARALRANMRRTLGMSLGVPPTAPFEALVDQVARQSGLPSEQISAALADSYVGSHESLVKLSETLESIRWETKDVHER
ncbi:MAG: DUF4350 domain-containing protein [Microthrixaceae bacterium]